LVAKTKKKAFIHFNESYG